MMMERIIIEVGQVCFHLLIVSSVILYELPVLSCVFVCVCVCAAVYVGFMY